VKLKAKIFAIFSVTSLFIVVAFGWTVYGRFWNERMGTIQDSISRQISDYDFSMRNFFLEVESDVNAIANNEFVRSSDDSTFTDFLHADEQTFTYDYSDLEKKIIQVFNTHRITHKYVNSVYMGRENGSFVRSHPREIPTRYDPRERPWYVLAKNNPSRVMKTEAYPSLTTSDINIGVVKALLDESGKIFGVVGIDITLANLTDYILNFQIKPAGKIFMVDGNGVIMATQEKGWQGKEIKLYSKELASSLDANNNETTSVNIGGQKIFVFHQNFSEQNWKIAVLIPAASIESLIREAVMWPVVSLSLSLLMLSLLTLALLHKFVIDPIGKLTEDIASITSTGNLDGKIDIQSHDEIGMLADSYNRMIRALGETQNSLKEAEKDLTAHRDHLEELVRQRTRELLATLDDLAAAKNRAESADRIKSAFLASMSHELRTPLNSIIGFTGIMLQGLAGPLNPEQKKQMTMVQNSSRHLLSLINDVLDISKIEAGQMNLSPAPFEIRPSIEKVVKLVAPLAEQKKIELLMDVPEDIGTLNTDQRRLEQIVLNLLSNAVKFTENGRVCVTGRMADGTFILSVTDTGIGIKDEDIARLFQPFHQIDTGTTRKYEGTGLGLSICRKLLDIMGGSISVDSNWGHGSTFTVRIPVYNGGDE